MIFYYKGHHSRAMCSSCKAMRPTTFDYRDMPFSDGSGTVADVLVGVCQVCDEAIQIPAQSIAAISKSSPKATQSLEAMFPAPYLELLDLACYKIDPQAPAHLRKGLLLFYIHRVAQGALDRSSLSGMLKALEARKALKSPVRKRLSMKVPERQQAQLAAIAESTGLKKTDVLRAVFGFIEEDIVQERSPELLRQMQEFSVLAAG